MKTLTLFATGAAVLLAGCAETTVTPPSSATPPPPEQSAAATSGSSQQIRYSQALLDRYGYGIDASALSLDQHVRLGRIDTLTQTGSEIRFDIDAVLRRAG